MIPHPGSQATEGPTGTLPTKGRSWDFLVLLTVPLVLAIDQITKQLIRINLNLGESWPATGFIRLTHGLNSGSAFGFFPNQTLILIIASIVAIGFLVYFYRIHALTSPLLRLAIGLQLGGALGNLVDRLRVGAVVDFIDVGRWPIFNVADSSIMIGTALLVGVLVLTRKEEEPASEPEPGPSSDSP